MHVCVFIYASFTQYTHIMYTTFMYAINRDLIVWQHYSKVNMMYMEKCVWPLQEQSYNHHHPPPPEGPLLRVKNRENAVATCANNLRYFGPAAALRSPQTDHQRRLSGSNPDLISTAVDLDSRHRRSSVPPSAGSGACCQTHPFPGCMHCQETPAAPSHPELPALLTAEHVRRDAALRQESHGAHGRGRKQRDSSRSRGPAACSTRSDPWETWVWMMLALSVTVKTFIMLRKIYVHHRILKNKMYLCFHKQMTFQHS